MYVHIHNYACICIYVHVRICLFLCIVYIYTYKIKYICINVLPESAVALSMWGDLDDNAHVPLPDEYLLLPGYMYIICLGYNQGIQ